MTGSAKPKVIAVLAVEVLVTRVVDHTAVIAVLVTGGGLVPTALEGVVDQGALAVRARLFEIVETEGDTGGALQTDESARLAQLVENARLVQFQENARQVLFPGSDRLALLPESAHRALSLGSVR